MILKTIGEIASMIKGELILNEASLQNKVKGVSIDSRTLPEDGLYIPIIGARVDGHSFIEKIENKAALTLCSDERYLPKHTAAILVDDTLVALQELAKNYRQSLNTKVIGITGSNGKTSCKDILAGCLSSKFKIQKTKGNQNNEIGVPLTLLELDEDCEVAVIEMGMEDREEIHFLNTMVDQNIAIITNVGIAHLENLGSLENIGHAKLEIVDNLHKDDLFLYCGDDKILSSLMKNKKINAGVEVQTFGKNETNSLYLRTLKQDEKGIYFKTNHSEFEFHIDILGEHQAYNALAAILVGYHFEISDEDMQKGFYSMEKTKMRNELMSIKHCKILNDAYKSNPQSALAALNTFEMFTHPYKVVVLADMLDLGPTTKSLHYDLGYVLSKYDVKEVLCMGELAKFIAEGANAAHVQGVKTFEDRESLCEYLKPYMDKDCMILFKGSRSMALDLVIDTLKEYGE